MNTNTYRRVAQLGAAGTADRLSSRLSLNKTPRQAFTPKTHNSERCDIQGFGTMNAYTSSPQFSRKQQGLRGAPAWRTARSTFRTSSSLREIMSEPISTTQPKDPDGSLINEDFKPTLNEERTFSVVDIASLWIGLVVCVPTYTLASSLIAMGMSWWQGVGTVLFANLLVLLPMILNGHPGTRYGVPFPVLARAAFGIHGAHIPAMIRGLVACGWFGIQTHIGGQAIYTLLLKATGGAMAAPVIGWLGLSLPEFGCFMLFWSVQVAIIVNGIECIRLAEKYSAPILIALSAALLVWAYVAAGGFGEMLSTPSQFGPGMAKEGQFWSAFVPAVTANVGFWATLALNIPDFTRYAKSQHDQLAGQAIGLPFFMAAFAFLSLAVTSATTVIFGTTISDPIQVLERVGGAVPTFCAIAGLAIATLSTNIAANVVAPANALVNLDPQRFSFKMGGLCTAVLGALAMPWKLVASPSGYIFKWLIGYSALLGPVTGILLADYYLVRKRELDVDGLFSKDPAGPYWYSGGYNPRALIAWAAGVLPNVPGLLQIMGLIETVPPFFAAIYSQAWFVGFAISSVVYVVLLHAGARMKKAPLNPGSA